MRALFLLGFLVAASLMGGALYFQYVLDLEPCPMCIFQRLVVIGLGILCLIGFIHNPGALGKRIYAVLVGLTAIGGMSISLRHVQIQNQPPPLFPECGGGLNQMLDTMPLGEVFATVLRGTGECSEKVWSLFGITIPGWTAVAFFSFLVMAVIVFVRSKAATAH